MAEKSGTDFICRGRGHWDVKGFVRLQPKLGKSL